MSHSTEAPLSFTTKIGGDLFTVRGNDVAEFRQNLYDVISSGVMDEVLALQEAAKGGGGTGAAVAEVTAQMPGARVVREQPTQDWDEPAPHPQRPMPQRPAQRQPSGTPACPHGEMVWKEGVSSRGPWKAWMCPAAKGDPTRCDPKWIR